MTPACSIIIPTRNEADNIGAAIASARAAFGAACECIVVDADSSDDTRGHAERAGARVLRNAAGRGAQLAAGADAARGSVLVFLHADTRLPTSAYAQIRAALTDPRCVGGAFRVQFLEARVPFMLRVLAAGINARSRLFHTATGDQAIFARAAVLKQLGGVPRVPLFEDVRLYRKLRSAGRVVLLDGAVRTSARLWQRHGTLPVILLHLGFRTLHAGGVSPVRLARWYARVSR